MLKKTIGQRVDEHWSPAAVVVAKVLLVTLPFIVGPLWNALEPWMIVTAAAVLVGSAVVDAWLPRREMAALKAKHARQLASLRSLVEDAERFAADQFIAGRAALHEFADEIVAPSLNELRSKIENRTSEDVSDSDFEGIRRDVLQSMRVLLSGNTINIRANYYRLEGNSRSGWKLRRVDRLGGKARTLFDSRTTEGASVVEKILRGESTVCLDISKDGPGLGIDVARKRDYTGFISVPVGGELHNEEIGSSRSATVAMPYGMLSVNTTTPGQLTPEDASLVAAMAEVLAVTEAMIRPPIRGQKP